MSQAFPHKPAACTYSTAGSVTEQSFQRMLNAWNSVAAILRTKPAGTMIPYGSGTLLMGEFEGALVMFDSPDADPEIKHGDFNLFRPDDFDGIDEEEFDRIHADLIAWQAGEPVYLTIDPNSVAAAIDGNFCISSESVADWTWNGEEVAEESAA